MKKTYSPREMSIIITPLAKEYSLENVIYCDLPSNHMPGMEGRITLFSADSRYRHEVQEASEQRLKVPVEFITEDQLTRKYFEHYLAVTHDARLREIAHSPRYRVYDNGYSYHGVQPLDPAIVNAHEAMRHSDRANVAFSVWNKEKIRNIEEALHKYEPQEADSQYLGFLPWLEEISLRMEYVSSDFSQAHGQVFTDLRERLDAVIRAGRDDEDLDAVHSYLDNELDELTEALKACVDELTHPEDNSSKEDLIESIRRDSLPIE